MNPWLIDVMNFLGFLIYCVIYTLYIFYLDKVINRPLTNIEKVIVLIPAILSPFWLLASYRLLNWIATVPKDEAIWSLVIPPTFIVLYFACIMLILNKEEVKESE